MIQLVKIENKEHIHIIVQISANIIYFATQNNQILN